MRPSQQRDPSELDRQIDAMLASEKQIQAAAKGDDPLLRAGAQLAGAQHPRLSAQARARIHTRIQQPVKPILQPNFAFVMQRLAAGFVLVVMLALTSIPAAASSLPGDLLYPVKLGWEQAELALARTDTGQVRILLTHANRRLDEQRQLFNRVEIQSQLFEQALEKMNRAVELMVRAQPAAAASLQLEIANTYHFYQNVLGAAQNRELLPETTYEDFAAMGEAIASRAGVQIVEDSNTQPDMVPTALPTPDTLTVEATPEVILADVTPEVTETSTEAATEPAPEATEEPVLELVHVSTPQAGEPAFIYARNRVNVRSGPGIEFAVIAGLSPDAQITVIGADPSSEWMQILLDDGRSGWIAAYLLTLEPSSEQITNGNSGTPGNNAGGDFGCDRPGNACNAPGQQRNNDNNATGNATGNNGQGTGRGGGRP